MGIIHRIQEEQELNIRNENVSLIDSYYKNLQKRAYPMSPLQQMIVQSPNDNGQQLSYEQTQARQSQAAMAYKQAEERKKIEARLEDYKKRTGLSEYIKLVTSQIDAENQVTKTAQVNQQQQQRPSSLMDFPFIVEAIDKAVARKEYHSYIDLMNDLAAIVKNDPQIPVELKNVMGDIKLVEYLKEHMPPNPHEQNVKYELNNSTNKNQLIEEALTSGNQNTFEFSAKN